MEESSNKLQMLLFVKVQAAIVLETGIATLGNMEAVHNFTQLNRTIRYFIN